MKIAQVTPLWERVPHVSISNSQRQIDLNYIDTVYNGIELADYPFVAQPSEPPYLAFLVAHGKTGFICKSYVEMAAVIPLALELNRRTCRKHVGNNFRDMKLFTDKLLKAA